MSLLSQAEIELSWMVENGEIVIVPIGFRCYTRRDLNTILKLSRSRASLPFDTGFFSPESVASVINKPLVSLEFPDVDNKTHTVCIKRERFTDTDNEYGIKFETSSYKEIDSKVEQDSSHLNRYLDTALCYYTLDTQHNFVLAHYNSHKISNQESDHTINIEKINDILNRRIQRMFEICKAAKYVFFIFGETENYKYIMIDDKKYSLTDLSPIQDAIDTNFKGNTIVTTLENVDSAEKLLQMTELKFSSMES